MLSVEARRSKHPLLSLAIAYYSTKAEASVINAEKPQTEQVSTVKAVPEQLPYWKI